jgi:hypothetical protein
MLCKELCAKRLGSKWLSFFKGDMISPCCLMHYRGIFLEGHGGAMYCNFHSIAGKARTDILDAANSGTGRCDQSNNTCVSVSREYFHFDIKLASCSE